MKRLKAAVIGAGNIAKTVHAAAYRKLDGVDLVGICDRDVQRAAAAAAEFGIPAYFSTHEDLLRETSPDLVSVCSPNRFHHEHTLAALAAGAHVLCEKPAALSAAEAEAMAAAARNAGKKLAFGFHWRHSAEFLALDGQVRSGAFGRVYAARVHALRRRGIPGWGSFTDKAVQGGGPLIDIGIHMLDAALALMSWPEPAYAAALSHDAIGRKGGIGLMGPWSGDAFTVEDALFGFVAFKNGATLTVETSFALNMGDRQVMNVHLFGDSLGATLNPPAFFGEASGSLTDTGFPHLAARDAHLMCVADFVEACRDGRDPVCAPDQAVAVQRIVDALYRSAETAAPAYL